VFSVVEPTHESTPDPPASEQAKLTATSLLFQPFAFAAGVRDPAIAGAVLSTVYVALVSPWPPRCSWRC
jgi:hypothetical protein